MCRLYRFVVILIHPDPESAHMPRRPPARRSRRRTAQTSDGMIRCGCRHCDRPTVQANLCRPAFPGFRCAATGFRHGQKSGWREGISGTATVQTTDPVCLGSGRRAPPCGRQPRMSCPADAEHRIPGSGCTPAGTVDRPGVRAMPPIRIKTPAETPFGWKILN